MQQDITREQEQAVEALALDHPDGLKVAACADGTIEVTGPDLALFIDEDGNELPGHGPIVSVGGVTASLVGQSYIVTIPAKYATSMAGGKSGITASVHLTPETWRDLIAAMAKAGEA